MTAFGWFAFFAGLLVSIMLHEAAHFVTARRYGMKAAEFFVGFGPTLWSRRRGETEYGVKAFPVGGYVKIVGMTPLEELAPGDRERAFWRRPAGHRAVVLASGSLVNIALAFVLLLVLNIGVGQPEATSTVRSVSPCVPAGLTAQCRPGDPPSPAARAGLRPGDEIVAFAGRQVGDWAELSEAIRTAPRTPVPITVVRGGARTALTATLTTIEGREGNFLGISPRLTTERSASPLAGVVDAGRQMGAIVAGVGTALASLPAAIPALFSPDRADTPGGQVGSIIGAGNISGQIAGADVPGPVKLSGLLAIAISLNVFVGVFNLLPLPPLDGGHLAVVLYGRVRAWLARRRGRPEPPPVDYRKLLPLTYAVFALLVGLGLLLMVADLVNPLKLP